MSITGLSLYVRNDGLHVERGRTSLPAVLAIPANTAPPVGTLSGLITVDTLGRTVFTLAAPALAGAINMVRYNGKTYFPPQFALVGTQLTWGGPSLPVNAKLQFLSFAGGAAAGHYRLEALVIDSQGAILPLDGTPLGDEVIYVDGVAYPQTAGNFHMNGNRVVWTNPAVTFDPAKPAFITYARTTFAADTSTQVTIPVNQTTGNVITLPFTPTPVENTRLYYGGQIYLPGVDFTVSGNQLTLTNPILFGHNDQVTVSGTTRPVLTTGSSPPPPAPALPASYYAVTTQSLAGASPFSLASAPAYPTSNVAALNRLSYVQGKGFTLSGLNVTWTDTPVKAGDVFQFASPNGALVAAGFAVAEIAVTDNQTSLPLPQPAAAAAKVILIISSNGSYGGTMHMGQYCVTPGADASHVNWVGPFALKSTDKVVALVPVDPAFAASLVVGNLTVATAGPTATITSGPVTNVLFATLDGAQLDPSEYAIVGGQVHYQGAIALKAGDELAFIGH